MKKKKKEAYLEVPTHLVLERVDNYIHLCWVCYVHDHGLSFVWNFGLQRESRGKKPCVVFEYTYGCVKGQQLGLKRKDLKGICHFAWHGHNSLDGDYDF